MRKTLINAYLDYVNNYLTLYAYADQNGLTREEGEEFINFARRIYYAEHPDK